MIQPNIEAIIDTSAIESVGGAAPAQRPVPEGQFQRALNQEIHEGELPNKEGGGGREGEPLLRDPQVQVAAAEIRQRFLARENLRFSNALPTGQYVIDDGARGVARPVAVPPLIQTLTAENQVGALAGVAASDLAAVADLDPQQLVAANRVLESLRAQLANQNQNPNAAPLPNAGGNIALPEIERTEPTALPESLRALLEQRSELTRAGTAESVQSQSQTPSAELLAQAVARRDTGDRNAQTDRSRFASDVVRHQFDSNASYDRELQSVTPSRAVDSAPEPVTPLQTAHALAQAVQQISHRGDGAQAELPFGENLAETLTAVAQPTRDSGGVQTASAALARAAEAPVTATPDQIQSFAELLATRGGGNVRLRLNPPNLGEIDLSVTVRGGVVDVSVIAQEPAAATLVASQKESLGEALASRELRMNSFEVSAQNRDAHEEQSREEKQAELHDDSQSRGFALPRNRGTATAQPGAGANGTDLSTAMPPPQHVHPAYRQGGIDVHV